MLAQSRIYELAVRPLGRSIADEYYHQGNTWIEGREGNTYTIQISNNSPTRTLFIVSVLIQTLVNLLEIGFLFALLLICREVLQYKVNEDWFLLPIL